jgi:hypothetical protein
MLLTLAPRKTLTHTLADSIDDMYQLILLVDITESRERGFESLEAELVEVHVN